MFRAVLIRICNEAAFPLACAIVWGAIAYSNNQSLYQALAASGAAFIFSLYGQGQLLRIIKNVRDETNFRGLQDTMTTVVNSIGNIEQALTDLRANRGPATTQNFPEHSPDATSFISQAEQTLKNGQIFSALLVAAVGFEQAIRRAAVRLGGLDRGPTSRLLNEIGRITGDASAVADLAGLLRLRNELVHARPDTPAQTIESAREAIRAFRWGIDFLDRLGD